jgi:cell division inhibitor SulA
MASTPSPRTIPEQVLFQHTWIQAEGLTLNKYLQLVPLMSCINLIAIIAQIQNLFEWV